MIDWNDPPCRICGVKREPHYNSFYVDHRFRGELQCEASCDKPSRWQGEGMLLCPTHKGNAVRVCRENGLPEPSYTRIYIG